MNNPLVSVLMVAYNHQDYIESAIDSVLSQETDFPFQLVICDDASTDKTVEIVRRKMLTDSRIILIKQHKNGRGLQNHIDGYDYIRTKYIAFCEGDDYWTSKKKLQKQVGFLEANQQFNVSVHRVELVFNENVNIGEKHFIYKDCNSKSERIKQGVFYADEIISNYYFHTSSFVFRWKFKDGIKGDFRKWMMLDHAMLMIHSDGGLVKYFDEAMSVWRRNETGYTWLQNVDRGVFFQKEGESWIAHYHEMDEYFHGRFHLQIRERVLLALRNMIKNFIEIGDLDGAKRLLENHKKWIFQLMKENKDIFKLFIDIYDVEANYKAPWVKENKAFEIKDKEIGGLKEFSMELIPEAKNSLWDKWVGEKNYYLFPSVLSALLSWSYENRVKTLWLPSIWAYQISPILKELWINHCFYAVNEKFIPVDDFLSFVESSDAVVTSNYFGRPLSNNIIKKLNELRQDKEVLWIEDRSKYIYDSSEIFSDACIYSPCDVIGVPSGAILVSEKILNYYGFNASHSSGFENSLTFKKSERKFIDEDIEFQNYILKMKNVMPDENKFSNLIIEMLKRIELDAINKKSNENFNTLWKYLAKYSVIASDKIDAGVYTNFPIYIPNNMPRAFFVTALKRSGILVEHYIGNLPKLGAESRILKNLVVLPCDQRYGIEDMERVAKEVLKIFSGESDLGCSGSRFNPD